MRKIFRALTFAVLGFAPAWAKDRSYVGPRDLTSGGFSTKERKPGDGQYPLHQDNIP
jgi:hypothetical protein